MSIRSLNIALYLAALSLICGIPVVQADDSWMPPETVLVPAGKFQMGSGEAEREAAYVLDETAYGHARTRKWKWYDGEVAGTKTTQAYRITKTPITNAEYSAFVKASGYTPPGVDQSTWEGYGLIHPFSRTRRFAWIDDSPPKGRDQHPVVLISIKDAQAYAKWLSQKTGEVWRLPEETEWEKASRGIGGRTYPWGGRFDPDKLNSHDLGPFDTTPVGSYPDGASPFGLLDAAGQVFEWTSTKAGNERFIVKGGSWDDKGCGICRPAARHSRPASLKHILIGFRLVQVIP